MSLPSWERGLKYGNFYDRVLCHEVAPLVGAWIEILCLVLILMKMKVAPLVGAWIEIRLY